ncbi:hypothetical protein LOD99_4708 [Oopsacas minuta]|uniref:Histone-lysine N-methyltransferase SETMAR n=1 Tax=Oopsacas minuta TaxID=111878 RepID=A0AAV7JTH1_9METZ|nr:hypothetical protein LOD99_4708 [Oopsacas minuta]
MEKAPCTCTHESEGSAGKRIVRVFCDMKGILLLDRLPEKITINSNYYIEEFKQLGKDIKHERRGKFTFGVLLQYDQTMPHVSSKTMDAIHDLGFECLPHLLIVQMWFTASTGYSER